MEDGGLPLHFQFSACSALTNLLSLLQYMGLGPFTWYTAFPIVVSWNMAWAVNSACHMWGSRPYETGQFWLTGS
jgi:fatty-acid desaturase